MAVFLGEDGALTMGKKTPITILQETLQKQGITPQYDLIYDGTGTLDPVFKYRVSAIGLTAIGDGKTKKEAKHDAAATFLKKMHVKNAVTENTNVEVVEEIDVASPYAGALKQNYVGTLEVVCQLNQLPFAEFVSIREEGPPHARIFTMQCQVGSLKETAVARTKKQAKHLSSQQMIKKLTEILGNMFIPIPESPTDNAEDEENTIKLKAIEAGSFKPDFAIPFSQMHNAFYQRIEEYPLPKCFEELSLQPDEYYEKLEKPKEFLDNIIQELNGVSKVTLVPKIEETQELSSDEEQKCDNCSEYKCAELKHSIKNCNLGRSNDDYPTTPTTSEDSTMHLRMNLRNEECICEGLSREIITTKLESDVETHSNCDVEESQISFRISGVVNLLVICPQGTWNFPVITTKSPEQALNEASVKAIKFLRMLSIRSKRVTS